VSITQRSSLLLEGADIHVFNLHLDGALLVRAVPGAHVRIEKLAVSQTNQPFLIQSLCFCNQKWKSLMFTINGM
jgi:hypothetical protein